MTLKNLFKINLVALLIFLQSCATRQGLNVGEIPVAKIPTPSDRDIAENAISGEIDNNNYTPITSGPLVKRATKLVDEITVAAGYPKGTFPVHVVDAGEEVNAVTVNSSSFMIYSELMNRVNNDSELMTIIGHEMAHALARHSDEAEEESSRSDAVSIGSTLLGTAAAVGVALAGGGGQAANLAGDLTEGVTGAVGYGVFVGSYSRDQEYEADHLGLMLMAKAGYDPSAALNFWSKASEVFGSEHGSVGAFFSTHPGHEDRLDELRAALPVAMLYYNEAKVKRK